MHRTNTNTHTHSMIKMMKKKTSERAWEGAAAAIDSLCFERQCGTKTITTAVAVKSSEQQQERDVANRSQSTTNGKVLSIGEVCAHGKVENSRERVEQCQSSAFTQKKK